MPSMNDAYRTLDGREYQCPHCRARLNRSAEDQVLCASCSRRYPVCAGIVDFLTELPPAVRGELQGLAAEQTMDSEALEEIKFLKVDRLLTWEDLVERTQDDPVLYHRQTLATFLEALNTVNLGPGTRVLEIGAEKTFPLLKRCAELGADCSALNIFFELVEADPPRTWPDCVLADMHSTPFPDCHFDLVVISAAAHHSTDLRALFEEVKRVLRPGGRAFVLNEAVAGYLKSLSPHRRNSRDDLIHEEKISYLAYRRAIQQVGFNYEPFFPEFFASRLRRASELHRDTRFYWLARGVGALWAKAPTVGERLAVATLPVTQSVLGFPLNAILVKP